MKRGKAGLVAILLGAIVLLGACGGLPQASGQPADGRAVQGGTLPPAQAEGGYEYVEAEGGAIITGFEDTGGDGAFAPPAQLGGAGVVAIGAGEAPLAGVEEITQLDLQALEGYRISRRAFAGSALAEHTDLTGAAAIGEQAFEGSALVPRLRADNSLEVGADAFAGAPYIVVDAETPQVVGSFVRDADGRRPGLEGALVLARVDGAVPAEVQADDAWVPGMGQAGAYGLLVTAAEAAGQDGYEAVSGASYQVNVVSYSEEGEAQPAAFASGGSPMRLMLPLPAGSGPYYLAVDGALGAEELAVEDGRAGVSLQSVPEAGAQVAVYTRGADENVPVTAVDITLAPPDGRMTVGASFTLEAAVQPDNATDKTLEWSSSDTAVLTVDGGVVTAVAAGSAAVTATAADGGGAAASVTIQVEAAGVPVTSVTITSAPAGDRLAYGDAFGLAADVQPANAGNKALVWSSSNAAILTVDGSGRITGRGVGRATVTAAAADGGGASAAVEVEVTPRSVRVSGITAKSRQYNGGVDAELAYDKAEYANMVAGDGLSVTAAGAFADAKPGTGKAVALSGLKLGGGAAGNYTLDAASQTSAVADITPRELTITAPELVTEKVYDGKTGAQVKPGTLTGVMAADASDVKVTAAAAYDNADAGDNKKITVTYGLEGSKAAYYKPPADTVVTNGRIVLQDAAPAPDNLTAESVESHAGGSIVINGRDGQLYALGVSGRYGYYKNGAFTEGWLAAPRGGGSVSFDGLAPNQAYTLYTRFAYDEESEAASGISAPLEVVLYTDAQQQVVDAFDALGGKVEDDGQVDALVALTKRYTALPAVESATLDSRLELGERLAGMQDAAAALNHSSNGIEVGGDGLPWYVRLQAAEAEPGTERWQEWEAQAGGARLVQVVDLKLTDLNTGAEYSAGTGHGLRFDIPLPDGVAVGQMQVLHMSADGGLTTLTPVFSSDSYTVEAASAGAYALAYDTGTGTSRPQPPEESGLSGAQKLLIVLIAVAAVALVVVAVLLARYRNKNQYK